MNFFGERLSLKRLHLDSPIFPCPTWDCFKQDPLDPSRRDGGFFFWLSLFTNKFSFVRQRLVLRW